MNLTMIVQTVVANMKLFIWKDIEGLTMHWHDGGSLLVVAVSLEAAKFLVANDESIPDALELPEPATVYELAGDYLPSVVVFPDQGCC
jgi:hypothetical protein